MDLGDLYRDVIVDHNRSPRNFGKLEPADRSAEGFNPLCGDVLTVYLNMNGDEVAKVQFEGQGCAISVASASLMTEAMKGLTEAQAHELFTRVHSMLTGEDAISNPESLGKLAALQGVRAFPSRVKCASLCWHTAMAALERQATPVSTE